MSTEPLFYHAKPTLFQAAESGNLTLCKQLMAEGQQAEAFNEFGFSPVHVAAKAGQIEILRFFAERGVNLQVVHELEKLTPAMMACLYKQTEVLSFLLTQNCAIKHVDRNGNSLAHYAAFSNQMLVFEELNWDLETLQARNSEHQSAFEIALIEGSDKVVVHLWKQKQLPLPEFEHQKNALHKVAELGHLALVKLLSEENLHYKKDAQGRIPLHLAIITAKMEVVKALVALDVGQISAMDAFGNTALHYAVASGDSELVKWLIQYGADVAARNHDGKTAFEMS